MIFISTCYTRHGQIWLYPPNLTLGDKLYAYPGTQNGYLLSDVGQSLAQSRHCKHATRIKLSRTIHDFISDCTTQNERLCGSARRPGHLSSSDEVYVKVIHRLTGMLSIIDNYIGQKNMVLFLYCSFKHGSSYRVGSSK